MKINKIIILSLAVIIILALSPFAVKYAIKQNHKVMLGQIFALAYEFRTDNKEWPDDLRFILKKYPDESKFVNYNWGSEYSEFINVMVINPKNLDAIIYDKIWKMSVDINGFVREDD